MKEEIKQRVEMIRKGVVPEGYKRTKVGIIPGDWEVKKLSKIGTLKNGINKNKEDFGSGTPFINLMDVFFHATLNLKSDFGLVKVSEKEQKIYNLLKGDVLFIRSSVKPSGVGLTSLVDEDLKGFVYSGFLIRFRENELNHEFKKYCFFSQNWRKQLIRKSTISANTNINQEALSKLTIFVPSILEQTTIAQILSTGDKAIETTETLINLKQQKKKWLMQNLLTGKVRLPEYDNCQVPVQERIRKINEGIVPERYKQTKIGIIPVDWEVKRIGKVKGIDLDPESLNNKTSNNYTFNYLSLSDVAEGKLLNKTRICFQNAPSRARKIVKMNDVLLSTVRPNLKSHLYIDWQESDLVCSTGFTVLRFDEKIINSLFIFLNCFSDNVDKQINSYLVGSNYPAITKKDVSALKIPIPSLTEQTAIANILSTADKEIDLLKQKLDTLKQQKKALMQLLLTGIVRTTGLNLSSDTEEEGVAYVQ